MSSQKVYESNIYKIAATLSKKEAFFFPAPAHEAFIKILKMMYDKDDAPVGASMNVFPAVEDPREIANRANMKLDDVVHILDKLVAKGLVWRSGEEGAYKYCMFAADPGIITTVMGKGEDTKSLYVNNLHLFAYPAMFPLVWLTLLSKRGEEWQRFSRGKYLTYSGRRWNP